MSTASTSVNRPRALIRSCDRDSSSEYAPTTGYLSSSQASDSRKWTNKEFSSRSQFKDEIVLLIRFERVVELDNVRMTQSLEYVD